MTRAQTIAQLQAQRPRRRFVIWSVRAFGVLLLASWVLGDFRITEWLTDHRWQNTQRFMSDLRPWPLHDTAWNWQTAFGWAAGLWSEHGADAFWSTLSVSLVAMVLAAAIAVILSLGAARNFACPQPFVREAQPAARWIIAGWRLGVWITRLILVFARAIPEYVWAFLFLAMLGPTAWPMILALALHNAGILGKLTAEIIENTDNRAPSALRTLGARRLQVALGAIFPLTVSRFLLLFFYRWETCIREATILGMLGMGSLGFWIVDARARQHLDEMLYYILLGVLLVLLGDVVSALSRWALRRA